MEWVSDADAARLLVGLCQPDVPEELWGHIWNIGGGENWRLTNWEFQVAIGGSSASVTSGAGTTDPGSRPATSTASGTPTPTP